MSNTILDGWGDGSVVNPSATLSKDTMRKAMDDAGLVIEGAARLRKFEVFESITAMQEQYRFPGSKKKRIRKKWAKRMENYRPITDRAYMTENMMICHPVFAARVRAIIAELDIHALTGAPCFDPINLDFLKGKQRTTKAR